MGILWLHGQIFPLERVITLIPILTRKSRRPRVSSQQQQGTEEKKTSDLRDFVNAFPGLSPFPTL